MKNDHSASNKKRNITINDVAEASGLSTATVSRVLSGYEFVKEATRIRVMKAVEQLGYVASVPARSLAGGRSRIIGLLVPNLDNGYVGTIAQGIDKALALANYDPILYTSHRLPSKETYYAHAIASGLTDGLLLIAPQVPTTYVDALREQNFPYVLIDQVDVTEKSTVVDSTNWQGAYEATQYLCQLGHERIAFIGGASMMQSAVDRLEGYKAALCDNDIPFREELVINGSYQQEFGYESTKNLLQGNFPPPTAIFASNDLSAFGAMDAVRECGFNIPDDISIVGFDDVPQASLVYPKLTTVRQPLEQMGRVAVQMLLERIEDRSRPPQRVTLATQLVIRDSCKAIQPERGDDPEQMVVKIGGSRVRKR